MLIAEENVAVPLGPRRQSMWRVLKVLQATSEPMTTSALMPRADLSRQSVHAVCDALIARGLVIETEPTAPRSPTGVGRKSRTFAFNERAGFVAGVELRPERIAAQLCDLRGDIVASTAVEHGDPVQSFTDLVDEAKRIIDDLTVEADVDPALLTTVAVGVPVPVDRHGVAGSATTVLGLPRTNVIEAFSAGRAWTVLADNDANLAVVGERWRGVAQGFDDVILMLVEESLGAGLIDSGRIIRGGNGFAGQMDFVSLLEGGRGTRGIVALVEHLLEQLSETDRIRITSAPFAEEEASATGRTVGGREVNAVFDAALDGDPVAQTVVESVADSLARATAVVANLFDPDIVVFACNVPRDAEPLLELVRRNLAALLAVEPPRLARSGLGAQTVATGAVRSALDLAHRKLIPD